MFNRKKNAAAKQVRLEAFAQGERELGHLGRPAQSAVEAVPHLSCAVARLALEHGRQRVTVEVVGRRPNRCSGRPGPVGAAEGARGAGRAAELDAPAGKFLASPAAAGQEPLGGCGPGPGGG